MKALSEALKHKTSVTTIDLGGEFLCFDEAAVMLAGVGNTIGDEGVKLLSEALKLNNSVTSLYLTREFVFYRKQP